MLHNKIPKDSVASYNTYFFLWCTVFSWLAETALLVVWNCLGDFLCFHFLPGSASTQEIFSSWHRVGAQECKWKYVMSFKAPAQNEHIVTSHHLPVTRASHLDGEGSKSIHCKVTWKEGVKNWGQPCNVPQQAQQKETVAQESQGRSWADSYDSLHSYPPLTSSQILQRWVRSVSYALFWNWTVGWGWQRLPSPKPLDWGSEINVLLKESWIVVTLRWVSGCWEKKTMSAFFHLTLVEISGRWHSWEAESSMRHGTEAVALGLRVWR